MKDVNWEQKIRDSYKGILSQEVIEETVKYWREFIREEKSKSYSQGQSDAIGYISPK